jgi:hypothetical protein
MLSPDRVSTSSPDPRFIARLRPSSECELSWICDASGGEFKRVPKTRADEAIELAKVGQSRLTLSNPR